ncbi:MAG TPA: 4-(cytidine 5'-diphospho)-2-C-methyl-D-erythritol kinase [Puia sp.]|jgi:4-diphosphocytidyl-2-C-methyl-D-erythritol kinase|nr:4-(cytidine 5'-diphospho)-2-C-methyl-D-erythritol kinase [Puia sp.]
MLFFPNCKINLGLKILRRRDDGFHDLETAFYPLPLKDVLEIVRTTDETRFSSYGNPIPGDPGSNLCLKAWDLLRNDFPTLPPIHIHLYKNIPIGAGLGGGSSDGASTLIVLNRQFQLGLTQQQLLDYAARLGSDCPFFILNKPCLGTGRGHLLQPLSLDLSGYSFALIDPGIHISTAQAFSLCTPCENNTPLATILSHPVSDWREALINDFEEPIFRLHPHLREIKDSLYDSGALYASLTGSGSSFFGIFTKDRAPLSNPFPDRYNYRILR